MTLTELAEALGATAHGNPEREITGLASIEHPKNDHLIFVEKPEGLEKLKGVKAVLLLGEDFPEYKGDHLRAKNGRMTFAGALAVFDPRPVPAPGIHPTAVVHETAKVAKSASIGANTVVEEGAVIGEGVIVYPLVYIGAESIIGDHTLIYANVSIYSLCEIGKNCIIHSGTVIGADGFGLIEGEEGHTKVPQIGTVKIGDDVEIGANCAIDRATIDATIIERGVKFDNMAHIGHNCRVGEHSRIVAQVGISGSVDIGRHVIFAGQAGAADHLKVGDYAIIYGRGGVTKDIPAGKAIYSGMPAQPHADSVAQHRTLKALTAQAPLLMALFDRVGKLEKALAEKKD